MCVPAEQRTVVVWTDHTLCVVWGCMGCGGVPPTRPSSVGAGAERVDEWAAIFVEETL